MNAQHVAQRTYSTLRTTVAQNVLSHLHCVMMIVLRSEAQLDDFISRQHEDNEVVDWWQPSYMEYTRIVTKEIRRGVVLVIEYKYEPTGLYDIPDKYTILAVYRPKK